CARDGVQYVDWLLSGGDYYGLDSW
nr:immunoglobulin heavy chain junction region [Macaca mulatta]MOV87212.1 immunoglobulin heavy chain junction region [Macaca mulatta]MOV88786.1 immunoglobulin heavy chain junction region [Macaca mulatta]MOV91593.1 immunoglobulin heavy chain junction region [Macaca mulatta]